MNLLTIAASNIPAAENKTVLKKSAGQTRDIIKEVLDCFKESRYQLKDFAPYLKGNTVLETCNNIWNFWKTNIAYKVDDAGVQWIKTPAAVWETRFCDCKSFSVAVASCLSMLGIDGKFRFVSYGLNTSIPTHVYVVAIHQGKEIIIDCVWDYFNSEKPFTKKWEYKMTSIFRVSGIGTNRYAKGELNIDVNDTSLTEAELELALSKQTLEMEQMIARKKAGIGAVGSALDNGYQVAIEAHAAAISYINGKKGKAPKKQKGGRKLAKALKKNDGKGVNKRQAKLLGKAGVAIKKRKEGLLKKVGTGLKKGIKAIPRLLVKTQLPKSAPFFLYTFITDEKLIAKLPEAVATKKVKADRYKSIIVDKLEMKPDVFDKVIRNGIMNQLGDTPENVIAKWMKDSNFSIGVIPVVLAAAKVLWMIVKKVAGKAVENMKEDVAQFSPSIEDWGAVSQETKNEMANQVEKSYDNGVTSFDENSTSDEGAGRESNAKDDPTPGSNLAEEKELENVTVKSGRKKEAGGGAMILLGLAAVGLMMAGKKGKRK